MKPFLFNYRCGSCDFLFKAPGLPDEFYGEFIMRSEKTGDSVYLNSFNDKVFDEVESLFKRNEMIQSAGKLIDAELFQSIFSISCDLARDGSQYKIGLLPVCPKCGSRKMAAWGPTNPPEYLEENLKAVTHESWNKLTNEEKIDYINEAVWKAISKG